LILISFPTQNTLTASARAQSFGVLVMTNF
jgi:hypothetical protein